MQKLSGIFAFDAPANLVSWSVETYFLLDYHSLFGRVRPTPDPANPGRFDLT
ncbi:MAG: hypothetical protein WC989_08880 [Micavibrio sp.]